MNKTDLCGLTVEEIYGLIRILGFEFKHAVTVANTIYKKGNPDLTQTSRISKRLKAFLGDITQTGFFSPSASEVSSDGTVKYLFRNPGGKQFETVFIPEQKRNTVCVSTQAGCRMGCPFCVTGKYGFHGDLSAEDILNQVISIPLAARITHIVFMGMGEPLDNLENTIKACNIITAEWGMAFSPRNITVSTVGITHAVKEFLERSDCNLALSLYSPFADERIRIIPAERIYPAGEIIRVMKTFPLKKKRRLSIAYVMMDGINDSDRHLNELSAMLKDTGIRVNLLPYHPVKGDMNRSSVEERMQFFKHNLVISGISASIRKSRGADISAACGLLASGF